MKGILPAVISSFFRYSGKHYSDIQSGYHCNFSRIRCWNLTFTCIQLLSVDIERVIHGVANTRRKHTDQSEKPPSSNTLRIITGLTRLKNKRWRWRLDLSISTPCVTNNGTFTSFDWTMHTVPSVIHYEIYLGNVATLQHQLIPSFQLSIEI